MSIYRDEKQKKRVEEMLRRSGPNAASSGKTADTTQGRGGYANGIFRDSDQQKRVEEMLQRNGYSANSALSAYDNQAQKRADRYSSLISDYNSFLNRTSSEYSNLDWNSAQYLSGKNTSQISALRNGARDLYRYYFAEGANEENSAQYRDQMRQIMDSLDDISGSWKNAADYYGQFEDEDSWNEHQKLSQMQEKYNWHTVQELETALDGMEKGEDRDYLSSLYDALSTQERYGGQADREQYQNVSKALEAAKTKYFDLLNRLNIYSSGGAMADSRMESDPYLEDLREQVAAAKADYDALTGQEEEQYSRVWLADKSDEYAAIAQEAKNARIPTTKEDAKARYEGLRDKWWQAEYTLPDGDPQKESIYNEMQAAKQVLAAFETNSAYNYINDIDGFRRDSTAQKYDFMSEDEIATYDFLYAYQGKQAAEDYLEYLSYFLDYQDQQRIWQETSEMVSGGGISGVAKAVGANVASVATNLVSGAGLIDVAWQKARNAITGERKPINFRTAAMTANTATQAIRGTTAQRIVDATGTIQIDSEKNPIAAQLFNGKGWADVYQLGMSMVDSAAVAGLSHLGIPGGTILLGGSAGTQGMLDALERGATDDQAITMGILNGTFEALFEYVSLDKLINEDVSKPILKRILEQAGVEGFEEVSTTVANTFAADLRVMGDQSELMQSYRGYKDAGFSDREASEKAWGDWGTSVLWDFVGGALSGGLMDLIFTPIKKHAEYKAYQKQYGESAQALVNEALELDPENKAAQKAQNTLQKGGELSGRQIRSILQGIQTQDKAAIQTAAEQRLKQLGETGDVTRLSAALAKQAAGEKLNRSERRAIQFSHYGNQVAAELNPETKFLENRAPEWRQKIGTKRFNTDEYNRLLPNDAPVQEGAKVQQDAKISSANPGYTVSEDGKAKRISTGETVQIQKVAETGDSGMKLELSDGTLVDAGDIAYASTGEAGLYEAVSGLGADAEISNLLVDEYKKNPSSVSIEDYTAGMLEAFNYGRYNYSEAGMAQDETIRKLTPQQRTTAYALGKQFGGQLSNTREANRRRANASSKAKTAAEKAGAAARKNAPEKVVTRREGTVKGYGIKTADLNKAFNNTQKSAYKILTTIAEVTGVDIVLYRSTVDANGNLVGSVVEGIDLRDAQGAFSWHNNKIYIDVNAGLKQGAEMSDIAKYSMLRTFSHEFTHFIEKWNPGEYKNFQDLVFETMEEKGTSPDQLIKKRMQSSSELTREQAGREVVAEAMTDILPQTSFIQNLAQKHEGLFQKLCKKLKEFAQRIRNYWNSIGANTSVEANALKETVGEAIRYTEDIVEAFDRVAEQAVENYHASLETNENADKDGGVQYKIRKSFYSEFDAWDGKNPSITFTVGTTSAALQSIGMKNQEIKMRSGMIISKLNKHVEMERDLFRQIPALLENPVIIQFSDAIDPKTRKQKYDSSITVLGELYAKVEKNGKKQGKPVLVSLELLPTNQRKTTILDFTIIKSAYSKNALQQYINENTILYLDPDKKRTNSWLSLNGLQLPVGENRYGSIRRISYADGKIKVQNSKNTTAIQKALEAAGIVDAFGNQVNAEQQERTTTLTNRDILQAAVKELDLGGFTEAEKESLKIYKDRLSELQKTEKAVSELRKKEKLTVADKNRLDILEGKLERQANRLWEIDQMKAVVRISEKAKTKLIEKYGAIPTGENPARKVSVPSRTNDDAVVSRTVRTAMEASATSDEMAEILNGNVIKGDFSYIPITDDSSKQRAEDQIRRKGWTQAYADWNKQIAAKAPGKDAIALGFTLYNNAVNSGDTKTAVSILTEITARVREGAQMVQAVRILKQLGPEARLYGIQMQLNQLQDQLNERYGDRAPQIDMNSPLAQNYLNAKTAEEISAAEQALFRDIAGQVPNTWKDKWNSLRYLSMLGNARTHVRNILGNAGFTPVRMIKDGIAIGMESGMNAITGGKTGRTKSVLNPGDAADRALFKMAMSDYSEIADMITGSGKNTEAVTQIERMKPAFGSKNIVERGLSKLSDFNGAALDKEDVWFSKPAYAAALAGYLKANHVTAEQFESGKSTQEFMDKARAYAVKEAQKATYRDSNVFSDFVSSVGRRRSDGNIVRNAFASLIEGVLPFRKTPANILVRGIEYSPVGLLHGIYQAAVGVKSGKVTAVQAIDSIASGLTGTMLLGLGAFLASLGLIRGGDDDDDKQQRFDDLHGYQSYALQIGSTSYTIDWLAPEAIPLFVGVELYDSFQEKSGWTLSGILDSLKAISEPMLEMSMLSGLNDFLDNISYSDNKGIAAITSAATSKLTQALPTLFGQIERIGEPIRESTFVDRNSQLTGDMQYFLAKAMNKMPGVEYNQIPYINAWGQEEELGNVAVRLLSNLLSPGYVSDIQKEAFEEELQRLYDEGYTSVLPSRVSQSDKICGKYLSADSYVAYAKTVGQTQYDVVKSILGSSWYPGMSDGDKASLIEKAYEYARAVGKNTVDDAYELAKWIEEAKNSGSPAQAIYENYVKNTAKDKYLSGELNASSASDVLQEYFGKDSGDAQMRLAKWDWDSQYPAYTDLSEEAVSRFPSAGVSAKVYYEACKFMANAESDKDKDGNAISGSKKEKVKAYIASLDISDSQKDSLWDAIKGNWKGSWR